MHNIEVRPLMDADLWGKVPPFPRYLMVATR
jgi:hypothetical protein